jgi:hypothetical protein
MCVDSERGLYSGRNAWPGIESGVYQQLVNTRAVINTPFEYTSEEPRAQGKRLQKCKTDFGMEKSSISRSPLVDRQCVAIDL